VRTTDPSQGVSRQEFDEMVRDLGIEQDTPATPAAAGAPRRPTGGPRARARADDSGGRTAPPPQSGTGGPGAADDQGAAPPPPGEGAPKKPRNRRHGRPR
jgi:SecD/SecF fusion protein